MKSMSGLFTFICFLLIAVSTQPLFTQELSYSIAIGGNYSNLDYKEELSIWDTGGDFFYTAAFNTKYKLSETFFLQSGFRVAQIGNDVKINVYLRIPMALPFPINANFTQTYIYLPIRAGYTSPDIWDIYLSAGLDFGYLLSAEVDIDYDYGDSENENIIDQMEKFNFCLNASVGHDFKLFSVPLLAEAGFSYGLLDVAKDEDWVSNWKTIELYLLVGIHL